MHRTTFGKLALLLAMMAALVLAGCGGDDGATGPAGMQGMAGPAGDAGAAGEKGEKGDPGEPGADADPAEVAALVKQDIIQNAAISGILEDAGGATADHRTLAVALRGALVKLSGHHDGSAAAVKAAADYQAALPTVNRLQGIISNRQDQAGATDEAIVTALFVLYSPFGVMDLDEALAYILKGEPGTAGTVGDEGPAGKDADPEAIELAIKTDIVRTWAVNTILGQARAGAVDEDGTVRPVNAWDVAFAARDVLIRLAHANAGTAAANLASGLYAQRLYADTNDLVQRIANAMAAGQTNEMIVMGILTDATYDPLVLADIDEAVDVALVGPEGPEGPQGPAGTGMADNGGGDGAGDGNGSGDGNGGGNGGGDGNGGMMDMAASIAALVDSVTGPTDLDDAVWSLGEPAEVGNTGVMASMGSVSNIGTLGDDLARVWVAATDNNVFGVTNRGGTSPLNFHVGTEGMQPTVEGDWEGAVLGYFDATDTENDDFVSGAAEIEVSITDTGVTTASVAFEDLETNGGHEVTFEEPTGWATLSVLRNGAFDDAGDVADSDISGIFNGAGGVEASGTFNSAPAGASIDPDGAGGNAAINGQLTGSFGAMMDN